eukprot:4663573-Alexandrium_andersonii.AAC.1
MPQPRLAPLAASWRPFGLPEEYDDQGVRTQRGPQRSKEVPPKGDAITTYAIMGVHRRMTRRAFEDRP